MATDPSKYRNYKGLNINKRLCKMGHHKLIRGILWHKCTRPGCDYYWEYD